ncbi:hypothetical protein TKK_0005591 [Trichogramma kaykai]
MKCSVKNCQGVRKFKFPKRMELRKKWLKAIRRPDFVPRVGDGLCMNHFRAQDIHNISTEANYLLSRLTLNFGAVPSIFPWQESADNPPEANEPFTAQSNFSNENIEIEEKEACCPEFISTTESPEQQSTTDAPEQQNSKFLAEEDILQVNLQLCEEEIDAEVEPLNKSVIELKSDMHSDEEPVYLKKSIMMQTDSCSKYNVDNYKHKPVQLNHFTGFNYQKFKTILYTLSPVMSHFEKIEKDKKISIPNQLFLTLWKLRRATCNLELAEHFSTDNESVAEIFYTWITIMSKTWSLIDMWPSRELINFYMPHTFKNHFPKTRVTLDATEIKIDAPKNSVLKQATFSTYKNANTFKIMVGTTPGGLISYTSSAYGGSTSDHQIIERSDLPSKCDPGDVILADKGIMVQDLFAPYNVTVSTPTPMVSGSLPHKTVVKDRKLSRHRVHIERLIGLMKTFTILSKKLTRDLLPLSTDIISVCVMLTNFKESIM